MSEKLDKLKTILAEAINVQHALAVLEWDQQTKMPPGGVADRANQLAILTKIQHDMSTSDELGQLLDELSSEVAGLDPDSDEARLVKVTRTDYEIERALPAALVEEAARASAEAWAVWKQARPANDFPAFAPYLKRNAAINREVASAIGYDDRPYDAFLKRHEPGMTTAQLETIFSELKAAIVPLVRQIADKPPVDDSFLHAQYDTDTQMRFNQSVIERFGYDMSRGRIDLAPHPFMIKFGQGDVRITTRVYPDFLNAALFATMHESGHALYEQGISSRYANTPLGYGASGGVHESQSRLWENLVGRSRPFQDYLFPRLQETYPEQLGNVGKEAFYKAINKVEPSLIRVEADEVTYNLHILLRFELENEMLENRVDINNLNEIWKERINQYLGITPPDDSDGVLQDMHWASAGYYIFPSYTLGNVIGAQLFAQAHKDMPDLDEQISQGEFKGLLGWLQSNLYQYGRKFTPNELTERITGQPVNTQSLIAYLRSKFSNIYEL